MTSSILNSQFNLLTVWRVELERNEWLIYCRVCGGAGQTPYHSRRHEKTSKHKTMVDRWQARMETDSHPSSIQSGTTNSPAVPVQSIYDLGATRLLQSLSNPNASHEQLPPLSSFTQDDQLQPPSENIDWNLLEDLQPEFSGSREEEGIPALNNFMLNIFEHGPDNINSDDEFDLEQPDESSDSEDGNNPSNNPSMRGTVNRSHSTCI